jgi:hypothetical protein
MPKKLVLTKLDTTQVTHISAFGGSFYPMIGKLMSMGVKFALIDPSKQADGSENEAVTARYTASVWDSVEQMLAFSNGSAHESAKALMKEGAVTEIKSIELEEGTQISREFFISIISQEYGVDLSGLSEFGVFIPE